MSLPDDDDLLRHARSGMTPGDDERAKMRARLLSSVAAVGAAGAAGGAASSAAASAATGVGVTTKLLLVALSVSAVGGIGYVATRPAEPPPAHTEVRTARPAPAPTDPSNSGADDAEAVHVALDVAEPASELAEAVPLPPDPEPVPGVESPRAAPTRALALSAPRLGQTLAPPPADPPPDALAEESALIRRARAALQRGDAPASLHALDAHARRYPDGFLAEEREVQRVRALCRQGDIDRAEQLAASFLSAHPGSMHAPAMRAPCGDAP